MSYSIVVNATKVLREIELVYEYGAWMPYIFWADAKGNRCSDSEKAAFFSLHGALLHATCSCLVSVKTFHEAVKLLGFKSTEEMDAWNDTPGRTKQQVFDRIRESIDDVEAVLEECHEH